MIKDEILFEGLKYLDSKDWLWMNNKNIAGLLGMHTKDFEFYFESKQKFETEVLRWYTEQHILDARVGLSCCFKRPIKRVKGYLLYLTKEYNSKPRITRMIFSPFLGGILHQEVSLPFVDELTGILASCLKETFRAIRISENDLRNYVKDLLESLLKDLDVMNRVERSSFYERVQQNNELLSYPESNKLSQFSF